MNGLTIEALGVRYGRRRVLDGIDAGPLPRGEVTALLGPNGSGKSTLLRALAGLCRLSGGRVALDGKPLGLGVGGARARDVVYLPQALPAGVRLQVLESVVVAWRATRGAALSTRRAGRVDLDRAHAVLRRLGIDTLAMRPLDELSGGQRQLAGIAQALVRDPQVLMLDEPLSALDVNYQFHVMQTLREETRRRGMVTLIAMHDIGFAMRMCDRAMLLERGRLVGAGAPGDVVTPAHVAAVFGVHARIEACSRGHVQVLIDGLVDPSRIASRS